MCSSCDLAIKIGESASVIGRCHNNNNSLCNLPSASILFSVSPFLTATRFRDVFLYLYYKYTSCVISVPFCQALVRQPKGLPSYQPHDMFCLYKILYARNETNDAPKLLQNCEIILVLHSRLKSNWRPASRSWTWIKDEVDLPTMDIYTGTFEKLLSLVFLEKTLLYLYDFSNSAPKYYMYPFKGLFSFFFFFLP